MLESHLLVQLAALAEYGTLSEASRRLVLSQPALSRSMRKLEEAIGVPLFERTKNHIAMNETGKLAAEYAQRLIQEEQEMVEKLRAFDRSLHTISIGCCAPPSLSILFWHCCPNIFPICHLPRSYPVTSLSYVVCATGSSILSFCIKSLMHQIYLHKNTAGKDCISTCRQPIPLLPLKACT